MKYVIGVDLGGTNIKMGLVEADNGKILNSYSIKTESEKGSDDTFNRIAKFIDEILDENSISKDNVLGIGMGIPGPVIDQKIVSFFANFPWEENLNVSKELGAKTGLEVKLDNDVNIITLGEAWIGAAKGYKNVLGIALGTGIGGGLLIDGHLYSGISGGAGEIGHTKVEADGKLCGCGHNGCWEAYASATGLEREATSRLRVNKNNLVWEKIDGDISKLEAKHVFDSAKEGDEFAMDLVEYETKFVALGLSNILNVLNPEIVVIGGGVSLAGDILFDGIKKKVVKDTMPPVLKGLKDIVPAKLGNDAGIVGAAALFTME
ncbi:MAG: ROK family protein [Fusobacteriota bacterium]